jgi:hypothetical protein
MYTQDLSDALAASAEHGRLSLELNLAEAKEKVAAARVAEAKERVGAELNDVAELESLTTRRLWASLRGSRTDDLDRERSELAARQADAAALAETLAQASADRQQLEAAMAGLGDVKTRRARALNAAEARLLDAGGGPAAQLVEISGQLASVAAQLAEVAQAKVAAKTATRALSEAARLLDSADDWSTYDTLLGGGMIASLAKHDRMDAASAELRAADAALRRLSAELADVGLAGVGGIDVGELTKAFDIWFDNIFSDWSVAGRIAGAAERTERALQAVATASGRLSERARELGTLQATLTRAREDVIIQR